MAYNIPQLQGRVIYEEFDTIGRTIHLDSLPVHIERKELVWNKYGSSLVKQYNGLWFKAVKDPSDHDMYGNIRFQLKLKDLINFYNNECQFYYVAKENLASRTLSTVLITAKTDEPYAKIDTQENQCPIWKAPNGTFYHATQVNNRPHVVEFLIDGANKKFRKLLYQKCERIVVNHGRANCGFASDNCHRYNRIGKQCPNDLTIEGAKHWITEKHPQFKICRNIESNVRSESVLTGCNMESLILGEDKEPSDDKSSQLVSHRQHSSFQDIESPHECQTFDCTSWTPPTPVRKSTSNYSTWTTASNFDYSTSTAFNHDDTESTRTSNNYYTRSTATNNQTEDMSGAIAVGVGVGALVVGAFSLVGWLSSNNKSKK